MIRDVHKCFATDLISESSLEKLDVISLCYDTINEGAYDTRVIDTASSYTYSLVMEILENAKKALLELCSMVLSQLNNYILNHAKLIEKYREILKDKLNKMDRPFVYEYFEYPTNKDYPKVLRSNASIEADVKQLQRETKENGWDAVDVGISVDAMLEDFAKKTVGEIRDVSELKPSVQEIVRDTYLGRAVTKRLTAKDLDTFIDEIKGYKDKVDDLKRTRKNIVADYELLKKSYEKALKPDLDVSMTKLEMVHDPQRAQFVALQKERYASIQMQMTRLFNGFIIIYQTAFNTKLELMKDRVERDQAIIGELLKQTSLTAYVNTKKPASYSGKPYVYEPKITT